MCLIVCQAPEIRHSSLIKVLALSQGDAQRGNKFRFSEAGAREVHYPLKGQGL